MEVVYGGPHLQIPTASALPQLCSKDTPSLSIEFYFKQFLVTFPSFSKAPHKNYSVLLTYSREMIACPGI